MTGHQRTSSRLALIPVALLALTLTAPAQTRIERHSNSYTPEQDVQLGRQAAAEVRKQMPLLNDERTEDFVEQIGERLIDEIPAEFRQPQFDTSSTSSTCARSMRSRCRAARCSSTAG